MTSFTNLPSNFILSKAPFIAAAPSLVAETLAKVPPKDPNAVLTADTIYTSFMIFFIKNSAKLLIN